jgi:hypothetical protein
LDLSNCTTLNRAFSSGNGGALNNITLKVTEVCTSYANTFLSQSELIEIRFTEDSTIAANIAFQQSAALSADSVNSIINALQDRTGTTGLTLYLHATVKAKMTDEQYARITAKNWTVA